MVFDREALGRGPIQIARTCMHVEYALACLALEMVVVTAMCGLVARTVAR